MINRCRCMLIIGFFIHTQHRFYCRIVQRTVTASAICKYPCYSYRAQGIQPVCILNAFSFDGRRSNGIRSLIRNFFNNGTNQTVYGIADMMFLHKRDGTVFMLIRFRRKFSIIYIVQQCCKLNDIRISVFFFRNIARDAAYSHCMKKIMSACIGFKKRFRIFFAASIIASVISPFISYPLLPKSDPCISKSYIFKIIF